jgi:hypothetical protein
MRDEYDFSKSRKNPFAESLHPGVSGLIVEAIKSRRSLSFNYNGAARVVQPHCYGLAAGGRELLVACELHEGKANHSMFDVSKMSEILIEGLPFQPDAGYLTLMSPVSVVYAQV